MNPIDKASGRGLYRRRLPHYSDSSLPQFITFRLFDSVPENALKRWQDLIDRADPETSVIYRKKVERFLDRGYGECFLAKREVALKVRDSLFFHHGRKYKIISWVIMPNHVHMLLQPISGIELEEIMHSIKSYTAHEVNKILGRTGQLWQHESFDRYIRNETHNSNVIRYIERNPIKARLCIEPADWEFSSAGR